MSTAPSQDPDTAPTLAGLPTVLDTDTRAGLLATRDIDAFRTLLLARAGAENGDTVARHLEAVYRIETPDSFAKPKIDLELGDIKGATKLRILVLFLAATLAGLVDTRPLGGWLGALRRPFSGPKPVARPPVTPPPPDELARMRALLDGLGEETWRMHVDWEDQDFGPEVYDKGLHGGLEEPGYMANCLAMQQACGAALGLPLDGDGYERLQNGALGFRGAWAVEYDLSPRHLYRHWSRADPGVLDEMSSRHFRRIRHRDWEVAAFNYLYGDDIEGFVADNPVIAEILMAKYGAYPQIDAALLDREFMRIEVSPIVGPKRPETVKAMIDTRLADFDAAIAGLAPAARDARLLEIARLHRWFEYLHPYRDGNTRLSVMVLNKVLVEHGFVPVVLAQRNDAPFHGDAAWCGYIEAGMERWLAIRWLSGLGLLDHVIKLRPRADVEARRAARRGRK